MTQPLCCIYLAIKYVLTKLSHTLLVYRKTFLKYTVTVVLNGREKKVIDIIRFEKYF